MSGWLGSLIGAGAQLGGAYLASQANQKASQQQQQSLQQGITAQTQGQQAALTAQTDATNRALQLQADMYNQNRQDLEPWRAAGTGALGALTQQVGQGWGPGSQGYDFQFSEGMRALDNSAASRGMLMSGAQAKAAERFGQGLASTARGEELNRLQALAGVGQTATTQGVSAGQGYANTAGGLTANLGTNIAAGQTALGQGLSGLYGQQGTAAANGTTGAAQPWVSAANNIWNLARSTGGGW